MTRLYLYLLAFVIIVSCNPSESQGYSKENAQKGKVLFENVGCTTCHSITGEVKYGPSLNNILSRQVEVFRDGKKYTLVTDRNYLKRSVMKPGYEKVKGFENRKMPEVNVTPDEVEYLVDYLIEINSKP
jgi:cytochrome c oxidase subunit II